MKLKVKRFRVHIGVNIGAEVRNGFPGPNKEVDAEIAEFGVLVRPGHPFATKLIPWSNVIEMDVEEVFDGKLDLRGAAVAEELVGKKGKKQ